MGPKLLFVCEVKLEGGLKCVKSVAEKVGRVIRNKVLSLFVIDLKGLLTSFENKLIYFCRQDLLEECN